MRLRRRKDKSKDDFDDASFAANLGRLDVGDESADRSDVGQAASDADPHTDDHK